MVRLETTRLVFRDHELGDLDAYCAIESDPEYRSPQQVHSRKELERSFRNAVLKPRDLGLFATIFKPENCYVGRCGLYPLRNARNELVPNEAFLAFYIGRPYWGRGIATEAGKAWVDFGFTQLGLTRIEAGVNADNDASLRVVEKLGFQRSRSGGTDGVRWHDFELRNPGNMSTA